MKERISTSRAGTISNVFKYYSQIENYQERYSKYCIRIKILEQTENFILTEEVWNITLGELDHVKIKVKYDFSPPNEIRFEIIDGFGTGQKNGIQLNEVQKDRVGAKLSWPLLDVMAQFYGDEDPVISSMARYFNRQDVEIYEGKQVQTKAGDPCPFCKEGKIWNTGGSGLQNSKTEFRTERYFQCDKCKKTTSFHEIGITDTIRVKDEVIVEKFPSDESTNN